MKPNQFAFVDRLECPACGSTNVSNRFRSSFNAPSVARVIEDFYKRDPAVLAGGEYVLDQCNDCGTIYQAQVGDEALLTELYSNWVFNRERPEDDPGYAYDTANPLKSRDGHEIMTAAAFLGLDLSAMTTLDYGMGWAGWARVSASLGCRSFGSDIATDRMAFARTHGVTTLHDHELGERRFDFINTEQAMEHMTDPSGITARLAAALKPGGILKISVPAQHKVERAIEMLNAGGKADLADISPAHPLEHVNTFTVEGLEAMGRRFGLRPVRPGLLTRYAFLKRGGAIDWPQPKRVLKELARPVFQYRNPANLYVWLQSA